MHAVAVGSERPSGANLPSLSSICRQGSFIEIARLGFPGVGDVRAGKVFLVEVDAKDAAGAVALAGQMAALPAQGRRGILVDDEVWATMASARAASPSGRILGRGALIGRPSGPRCAPRSRGPTWTWWC